MRIDLDYTIAKAVKELADGALSSVELTRAYLDQVRGLNVSLNAYLTVLEEPALEAAKASDVRRADGLSYGPLDGIPIALKDNLCVSDVRTTA